MTMMHLLEHNHIIDNGGERRLDVMGNVGDQICLQPFILHTGFHCCAHAVSNVVHCSCHHQIIAIHSLFFDLLLQIAFIDLADAVKDLFPGNR